MLHSFCYLRISVFIREELIIFSFSFKSRSSGVVVKSTIGGRCCVALAKTQRFHEQKSEMVLNDRVIVNKKGEVFSFVMIKKGNSFNFRKILFGSGSLVGSHEKFSMLTF